MKASICRKGVLSALPSGLLFISFVTVLPPEMSAQEISQLSRSERFLSRPAPKTEMEKLRKLLGIWTVQDTLQIPTPRWAPQVPEAERKALKSALLEPHNTRIEVAERLLAEARRLKANPETSKSADRFFILAAMKGAYDLEALTEINRSSSNPALREQARRFAILVAGRGKPFADLAELGIPLPNLKAYLGSPVAIVFWAAWDPRFQVHWPRMKASIEKLQKSGFKIVGINFDPEKETAASFIDSEGIKWPSLYPGGNPLRYSKDYGLRNFPAFWIVDAEGNLISTDVSPLLDVQSTLIFK